MCKNVRHDFKQKGFFFTTIASTFLSNFVPGVFLVSSSSELDPLLSEELLESALALAFAGLAPLEGVFFAAVN